MVVDDRFNFLRVDLQSPDIDGAVPSPSEVAPVAASLYHVAGVDEHVSICDRMCVAEVPARDSIRADAQRTIFNLRLHIATGPEKRCGKSFRAIRDFECNAGLGRRERMADPGVRKA